MFNMPDIGKLTQSAKEIQERQEKNEQKKMDILLRIEAKLDQMLQVLKKQ